MRKIPFHAKQKNVGRMPPLVTSRTECVAVAVSAITGTSGKFCLRHPRLR